MTPTVRVAPGTGLVRRRATAVLFLPTGDERLLGVLGDSDDGDGNDGIPTADEFAERLGDAIVDLDDTPPCCLIAWNNDAGPIVVMVRGDLEVSSDLPTLPSLTGQATSTWVEHRIRRHPERGELRCGQRVDQRTALESGVVAAGGVAVEFVAVSSASRVPAEPTPRPRVTAAPVPSPDRPIPALDDPLEEITLPEPDLGQLADADPVSSAAGEPAADRWDPLAQLDGDWAEASLGLDGPPPTAATTSAFDGDQPERPSPSTVPLDPALPRVPATPDLIEPPGRVEPPDLIEPPGRVEPSQPAVRSGPPAFPGELGVASSADSGEPTSVVDGSPRPPVVPARLCRSGHANAPHLDRCVQCAGPIDVGGATVTVERPVFAALRLPNGDVVPVESAVVIGRRPAYGAARVEAGAIVALDQPTVSRTHLVVQADGWDLVAIDCGSSSGSALAADGRSEVVELSSWVPHEISIGDTLYLGGPHPVEVVGVAT